MDGYIKIFRQLLNWEWYTDGNVLRVFLHLLLNANFKPSRFRGLTLPVGALVVSIDSLSASLGLSSQQIRTALKKLENTGEINKQITNKFTIITICKWECYQAETNTEQQTNNKQITDKQQTNNKQITTEEENVRKKEDSNIIDSGDKSPSRTKFQKPTLQELQEFAFAENLMNVDCNRFFDYYESNGWKVGRNAMKDWRATLRNWNRTPQNTNNQQFNNKNYGRNQQTDAERLKVPHIGTFTDEQFDAICEMGRMLSKQNASD